MAAEAQQSRFDEEIAQIENRAGTRRMFTLVAAGIGIVLLAVVVFGARERMRLAKEAARPKTEEVVLGRYLGTASNQAVFARGNTLVYLEGVGNAEIGPATTFAHMLEYDAQGNPVAVSTDAQYWKLDSSDSLPYVVEVVANPLTGVNPDEFRMIDLASLRRQDYGVGGPGDWRMHEQEHAGVQVSGAASRSDGAVTLTGGSNRVRVQGIEGLSPLDSLEVAWATENNAPLTAFGTISSSPRGGDVLFVMTAEAVEPPRSQPATEAGAAAPTAPADTTTTP